MTSSRDTLNRFTDAAAQAVAREIATLRREAQRERELRDAQFAARVAELEARIAAVAELERRVSDRLATLKDGEPGKSVTMDDLAPLVEASVARAVASLPAPKDGEDGRSITAADVQPMLADLVAEAVREIPAPRDGKDADPDAVAALVEEHVARAVAALPPAEPGLPGKSVTVDDVAPMIADLVRDAVAAIPPAEPGRSVTSEDVAPMLRDMVRAAVDALPPPERGEPGPMGALPVVEDWQDRVYYQGNVVAFAGGVYQARRDTGKAPDHDDWSCIVRPGRDGEDGRSFTVRGTWVDGTEYQRLDVVALDGAGFVARRDDPGACPGEGWQMIAMRGKPGRPGDKGSPGVGLRGLPGPAVSRVDVDDQGLLRLVNADGSTVECDLYPVLSKLGQ